MLHIRERWVQFHEMVLSPEPPEAPNIALNDVLPYLIKHIEDREAYQLKDGDRSAFRIQDYYLEKNKAVVLLFQYADQDATDPVFADLQTGELRHEPKLQGEGVAVSAHVVLGLHCIQDKPGIYPILLEVVPGLGRSSIGPFLRKQLKEATKGVFDFIDNETRNKKPYKPAVELLGTPSTSFVEELEDGVIAGIELINKVKSPESFDEEGYFIEESHTLKVKVQKAVSGSKYINSRISSLRKIGKKKGYDELRVRYKKKEGRQKSVIMGTTEDDLKDVLVVKDELITSNEDLMQCTPEINRKFAQNMLDLLSC